MSELPGKSWHQVVTLRDGLKRGELMLQVLAADLTEGGCH
jgi:hypothetical protein